MPQKMKDHTSESRLTTDFFFLFLTTRYSCPQFVYEGLLFALPWWLQSHQWRSVRPASFEQDIINPVNHFGGKSLANPLTELCSFIAGGISSSEVTQSWYVRLKCVSPCISHWIQYSCHHSLVPKQDSVTWWPFFLFLDQTQWGCPYKIGSGELVLHVEVSPGIKRTKSLQEKR